MPGDMCDRMFACPHTLKFSSMSEKSPMPTSLSAMQSHTRNWNFVVTTATLVTVTYCFHNSALSCFILNEIFDMLQQQETLYFGYVILASYVQLQIITANQSNTASTHVKIDAVAPISSGHGLLRSTRCFYKKPHYKQPSAR